MVHEIIRSRNRILIDTAILTSLILLIGFAIGFFFESYRADNLVKDYKNFEVDALDLKLQNYYYQILDQASCSIAFQENIDFADRIYEKGLIIEKYEDSNQLKDNILQEKKKYVLLQTELWLNSILLKKKCNNGFHTVVYLYSQKYSSAKEAEQSAISNTLKELKDKLGNKIILIPLAGDIGLNIVEMQMRVYNITYLPSVIIDEDNVLTGYHILGDYEKYLG